MEVRMEVGFVNLKVSCIVGIHHDERLREQIIEADVMVDIDVEDAVKDDDIGKTTSYSELARLFGEHAGEGRYQLLETLTSEFKDKLVLLHGEIRGGSIEVRKPSALADADAAVVRLKWGR